jgi:hypothetical protein
VEKAVELEKFPVLKIELSKGIQSFGKSFSKNGMANQTDPALLPFLNSSVKAESENLLADLLTSKIQPFIEKTLRAKLRVSLKNTDFSQTNQEALELAGEIKLQLVSELKSLKSNPNGKVIFNLDGYVMSVTVNMYRQYLRAKYPLRQQLKSRLRYLLSHHPKFALWEVEGVWLCGFKKGGRIAESPAAENLRTGILETVGKNDLRDSSKTIDLVAAVFEYAKTPVPFNDLLLVVAEVQEIKERREISDSEGFSLGDDLAISENKMTTEIEQQEYLRRVWAEICALPIRHRVALLLNLKDRRGDCVIRLFPLLRIASIRKIAETLEIAPEEFVSVWNELPWDDLKIAEYLGLTRQQVINLRQSARARLTRLTGE